MHSFGPRAAPVINESCKILHDPIRRSNWLSLLDYRNQYLIRLNSVFGVVIVGITAASALSFYLTGYYLNCATNLSTSNHNWSAERYKSCNAAFVWEANPVKERVQNSDNSSHFPREPKAVVQSDFVTSKVMTEKSSSSISSSASNYRNSKSRQHIDQRSIRLSPSTQRLFELMGKFESTSDSNGYRHLKSYFKANTDRKNGHLFVLEVLKAYESAGISDSDKDTLHKLLTSSGHGLVELFALNRIERDGAQLAAPWLRLLANRSSGTSTTRRTLLTLLPDVIDPLALSLGIAAIRPGAIPDSDESMNTAVVISEFFRHEDERVRAATITTLSALTPEKASYRHILEQALSDPSNLVKTAALSSVQAVGILSKTIELKLVEIIKDRREEKLVRQNAYEALQQFAQLNQ